MADKLIALDAVSVRDNGRDILVAIDLAVHRGEIVTLIGPNGSGKTTLIRAVLGLLNIDSGTIWRERSIQIGYMPQRIHIDPVLPLTVSRFLTLRHRTDPNRVTAVLEETAIKHLCNQPVQEISGGELQRVLLARALLSKPDLLVLDEPAQGVDINGQEELYALISRVRDEYQCGVLLVSHDLHLVMAASDQVICLNQHVCCSGQPDAVSQHPEYLSLFGDRFDPALAPYTHHHDHVHDSHGDVVDGHNHKHDHKTEHDHG